MIRLVISNQRGGVSKTTTTATLAREFADRGKRVLVIDTDPQGSISSVLNLKPEYGLYNFVIEKLNFNDCIVKVSDLLHVMCSSRETTKVETILMGQVARENAFTQIFGQVEQDYDVVLIDVSPSITLLQTCAMVYAKQVLIPIGMDTLSFQGAMASIEASKSLNQLLTTNIRTIGLLPVMVDRRLAMTTTVLEGLEGMSKGMQIPLLHAIRTDQSVTKAARAGKFLVDFDPKCKAYEDYHQVADELEKLFKEPVNAGSKT
ncbi:ParA family protein [Granulicella arctica]|uniref:ParA family protein n=1 Tax=Granulicella arctica TaxID=940613 RepID=UPI0021E0CFF3|nr:ParA family protein [Granulicella arctica]